jgi:hypothetical protein
MSPRMTADDATELRRAAKVSIARAFAGGK